MQSLFSNVVGSVVQGVARLRYIHKGEASALQDDLELRLDGNVLRLCAGGDGERLDVERTPWFDSFAEPLDAENAAYVASHGKAVLVDVSACERYAELIGAALLGYELRYLESGKVTGATLFFEKTTMHVFVEFDELEVSWSPPRIGN